MRALRIKANTNAFKFYDLLKVNNAPYDLTGATVRFRMRRAGAVTAPFTGSATVTNAAGGEVEYQPGDNFPAVPGIYRCDWLVTLGTSTQQVPTGSWHQVEILPDIGAA